MNSNPTPPAYYLPSPVAAAIVAEVYGDKLPAATARNLTAGEPCHADANPYGCRVGRPDSGSDRAAITGAHVMANMDDDGNVKCAFRDCKAPTLTPRMARNAAARMSRKGYDPSIGRVEGCHVWADAHGGCYCLHNVVIGCGDCNDRMGDATWTYAAIRSDYRFPTATVKPAVWRKWRDD